MTNSMEQYSIPLGKRETKLCTIWQLNPRRTKPGRELDVCYDARFPLVDFVPAYSYVVRFEEADNAAGNHYHEKKQEISIPLQGSFEVHLEDVATKEKEVVEIDAKSPVAFYVRTGVAHKVVSREPTGILLVFASSPSDDADEIAYEVA